MAKILLAEDDEFVRDSIALQLGDAGHVVTTAIDGKLAQAAFEANQFDLVISDIQMPNLSGVEFLKWIRERSKVPFIIMTGFSTVLETKAAFDAGASYFLTKPFSSRDLKYNIDLAINAKKNESSDRQYCKVSLSEFVANPKLDFDIYIHLGTRRYLKIANSGERLDVSRLKTYEAKGLRFLNVKKEDFGKVVKFNLHVVKSLSKLKGIDLEKSTLR